MDASPFTSIITIPAKNDSRFPPNGQSAQRFPPNRFPSLPAWRSPPLAPPLHASRSHPAAPSPSRFTRLPCRPHDSRRKEPLDQRSPVLTEPPPPRIAAVAPRARAVFAPRARAVVALASCCRLAPAHASPTHASSLRPRPSSVGSAPAYRPLSRRETWGGMGWGVRHPRAVSPHAFVSPVLHEPPPHAPRLTRHRLVLRPS